MKSSKIIKYLKAALNQDDTKKKAALKKVLDKIKKKGRKLNARLAATRSDKEKAEIQAKIKVNRAHRKKAIDALRKLSGKD